VMLSTSLIFHLSMSRQILLASKKRSSATHLAFCSLK
jgi:hypothetical protein